ncbi:beta family protein [Pseudomonas coronafaciens]|uniref:beta family protein n=1 Tax=Pseudomonas coronafaciens TaxID=53409 RepID=UPI001604BA5E|nr:hypothetical protein [Pseudomonas coronafaciens]
MQSQHSGYPPYIPIIKWQPAERRALDEIDDELIDGFCPCIEVRNVTQHALFLAELHHSWEGAALVDYANPNGRLTKNRYKEFDAFVSLIAEKGYPIIPVIDSRDMLVLPHAVIARLSQVSAFVVRLRLQSLVLDSDSVEQAQSALKVFGQKNVRGRLLVDLGTSPSEWHAHDVEAFVAGLRDIKGFGYETIHLASGAYPPDLTNVPAKAEFVRRDWGLWNAIKEAGPDLLLGYSDYGILSPAWTEEKLKKIGKKATLRYTRDTDWLILRADGKTLQDSIDLSVIMVTTYADNFEGKKFSLGDRIIADRADSNVPSHKKRSYWYHIMEGLIHHIAMVVKKQY